MEATTPTKITEKIEKLHDIRPINRSKVSTWIYYIYNTFLVINAISTIILTFIDDDWKESHNFNYITKITQWSLGTLIFVWILFYKIIPTIKEHITKKIILKAPQIYQKKVLDLEEKKKKLLAKIEKYKKS